ncbi:MAG TPA: glutathione S-transferase family protein [Caulobacteraceae bacterium]|jgi:glutathione S-transferase|nr:glutathione S-transferase family protein [Caulobacteraceae bacterium]
MELLIGDKLWSTWSMRPWLALRRTAEPFTETLIRLRREETNTDARAAGSPNGKVPVLKDGELVVWDSLAICEHLAERFPAARLWPTDPVARSLGRAAAAEMHAGFASLRGECPMDLGLRQEIEVSELTHADLRRLVELWSGLLGRFGGQFLVGDWSIADAFYTPVATRLRSYGLRLSDYGDQGACAAYAERLLQTPEFLEWQRAALADKGRM